MVATKIQPGFLVRIRHQEFLDRIWDQNLHMTEELSNIIQVMLGSDELKSTPPFRIQSVAIYSCGWS